MHRFFVASEDLSEDAVRIRGPNARQIRRVLRLKPGDHVEVMDGAGACSLVQLERVSAGEASGRIVKTYAEPEGPLLVIRLAQALPRLPKMDLIIQKATELGASQIFPLRSERSLIRAEASELRFQRWRTIAKEAAEQSRRRVPPAIEPPQDLGQFLQREIPGRRILLWEGEALRLRDVLQREDPSPSYTLLVGPEGGFTANEVERAVDRGFVAASLGPRILRTESVALVALSLLQYEKGDLG